MDQRQPHILFICSTPLNIIIATHIVMNNKNGVNADILITDHSKNYEKLVQGVKKAGVFTNVYTIKCQKEIRHGSSVFDFISYFFRRNKEIFLDWAKSNIFAKNKQYDELYIVTISVITVFMYNALLRRNANLKLNIFEEGMATYCHSYTDGDKPTSLHRRFVNKSGIINNTKNLWLFRPELLQWKLPNGELRRIKPIDVTNNKFVNAINTIFDIKNIKDNYDEKVIFFEQSFFADGVDIQDVDIVNHLAEIYGKDNILIKLHPRNYINRFEPMGYKTNIDTSIPWEAIVINKDFSNKILITISSGSTMYPYLYFGIKAQCIALMKCLNKEQVMSQGELGEMMLKIYATYPEIFSTPSSFEELKSGLNSK